MGNLSKMMGNFKFLGKALLSYFVEPLMIVILKVTSVFDRQKNTILYNFSSFWTTFDHLQCRPVGYIFQNRAVASLTIPGGKSSTFLSIFPQILIIFSLLFFKLFSFSSSLWFRNGPGYATVSKTFKNDGYWVIL